MNKYEFDGLVQERRNSSALAISNGVTFILH